MSNEYTVNWKRSYADYVNANVISKLAGRKLVDVAGLEVGSDQVDFVCEDGYAFRLYHSQDCCESVNITDIDNDIDNYKGATILSAEEVQGETGNDEYGNTYTWTFYKIETDRGGIFIRWYGESNGYYSESVDAIEGEVIK